MINRGQGLTLWSVGWFGLCEIGQKSIRKVEKLEKQEGKGLKGVGLDEWCERLERQWAQGFGDTVSSIDGLTHRLFFGFATLHYVAIHTIRAFTNF